MDELNHDLTWECSSNNEGWDSRQNFMDDLQCIIKILLLYTVMYCRIVEEYYHSKITIIYPCNYLRVEREDIQCLHVRVCQKTKRLLRLSESEVMGNNSCNEKNQLISSHFARKT